MTQYWKGKKFSNEHKRKISESHSGSKNYLWKGGRNRDKNGYILVMAKWHKNCNPNGYVREHRLVMEDCIGRYLNKGEVVHHINGKKDDNRIENLRLYVSDSEHKKDEHKNGNMKAKKKLYPNFICKCGNTKYYGKGFCHKCYDFNRNNKLTNQ